MDVKEMTFEDLQKFVDERIPAMAAAHIQDDQEAFFTYLHECNSKIVMYLALNPDEARKLSGLAKQYNIEVVTNLKHIDNMEKEYENREREEIQG